MAGSVPSFLSSGRLVIKIGQSTLAYATSLVFSDDMANVPIGGIGSFNYHTNEPVGYIARGSMTITQYSDKVYNILRDLDPSAKKSLPDNLRLNKQNSQVRDGNSMLIQEYFSPVALLSQRTFDIEVYERGPNGQIIDVKGPLGDDAFLYLLKDCRMTGYSLSFTPGQILSEAVSFMCLSIEDSQSESSTKSISYKEV